ncbi:hypothetical protein AX17_006077, partial [Amanita inopinata Kibby_2008]
MSSPTPAQILSSPSSMLTADRSDLAAQLESQPNFTLFSDPAPDGDLPMIDATGGPALPDGRPEKSPLSLPSRTKNKIMSQARSSASPYPAIQASAEDGWHTITHAPLKLRIPRKNQKTPNGPPNASYV